MMKVKSFSFGDLFVTESKLVSTEFGWVLTEQELKSMVEKAKDRKFVAAYAGTDSTVVVWEYIQ